MAPKKPDSPPNETPANMKTMYAEGCDWMPHALRLYHPGYPHRNIGGWYSDPVDPVLDVGQKKQAARRLVHCLPTELTQGAAGKLRGLLAETFGMYDTVLELPDEEMRGDADENMPLEERGKYAAAYVQFLEAVTNLGKTSLAELKQEGLETSMTDEHWTEATNEARSLSMRGDEVCMVIPVDFVERVLDYILRVLKTLKQLYKNPDREKQGHTSLSRTDQWIADRESEYAALLPEEDEGWAGVVAWTESMLATKDLYIDPWLKDRWQNRVADAKAKLDAAALNAEKAAREDPYAIDPRTGWPYGFTEEMKAQVFEEIERGLKSPMVQAEPEWMPEWAVVRPPASRGTQHANVSKV